MKYFSSFTLFLYFFSLAAAIPVPTGGDPAKDDIGKGRAVDPSSRPHTPTPEDDPNVPLPGRSGIHTDPHTHVVTMYYGDDALPEHMGHLQRNQGSFPHNRNALPLSTHDDRNRQNALHNVPAAPPHPVTHEPRVRDEKLPNMLHNPHHQTSTTVEYLPDSESRREGGHLQGFKDAIAKAGPNGQGQLRPNPGWLPLHPDQRRGHEAPARLNSQTFRPTAETGSRAQGSRKKDQKPSENKEKAASGEGYTPSSGQMTLRHRKGVEPPPPAPQKEKRPAQVQAGGSNLRPGHVLPAGHVWRPSTEGSTASHFGAPGHLPESEKRHPPRPQNHEHYMKQLKESRAKEASEPHKAPTVRKGMEKYLPNHSANLEKFEKQFGPARHPGGGARAHEAPARMESHGHHAPPHSTPPTKPHSPHSPEHHGSGSSGRK